MPFNMNRRFFCSAIVGTVFASSRAMAAGVRHPIIVNALGNLYDPNIADETFALSPRVLREALASGLTVTNVTLGGTDHGFERTVREIAAADRALEDHADATLKVLKAADIRRAKAEKKIGVIYGFQQLEMIEADVTRIDVFVDMGVRVFQLTYNTANRVGSGAAAPEKGGLTPFGYEVVSRLNDQRVMVDLSHSSEQTCLDAIRASRTPISINHTGCRALVDLPRNKTDQELRLVASRGGFVGIFFMPFVADSGHAKAEDVVAHIDHAVNVCGEDHVGIGTDGSVTQIDDLQSYTSRIAQEVAARQAAGISAKGERPDTVPFVVDLRGPKEFHKLIGMLRSKGYSTTRIEKIMVLNFVRFADDIWGA